MATGEKYTNKEGREVDTTMWHNLVFFNRLAEVAEQYLAKGSRVYVEGSLEANEYTNKDGQLIKGVQVVVRDMIMLGGESQEKDRVQPEVRKALQGAAKPKALSSQTYEDEFVDDEIPF